LEKAEANVDRVRHGFLGDECHTGLICVRKFDVYFYFQNVNSMLDLKVTSGT
jgi:hypothetical protein